MFDFIKNKQPTDSEAIIGRMKMMTQKNCF